jgi:hypothetical protein
VATSATTSSLSRARRAWIWPHSPAAGCLILCYHVIFSLVCLGTHTRRNAYMCTRTYVYTHTHIFTLTHTHTHTRTHTHAHTHTHTHAHTHTHTRTHAHVHSRAHVHAQMHTYTHARAHTCIPTQCLRRAARRRQVQVRVRRVLLPHLTPPTWCLLAWVRRPTPDALRCRTRSSSSRSSAGASRPALQSWTRASLAPPHSHRQQQHEWWSAVCT